MNKYSSKAVKTAATVGMSLAMVLGNVAPVLAADGNTQTTNFCTNVNADYVKKAMDEFPELTDVNDKTEMEDGTNLFGYVKKDDIFKNISECYFNGNESIRKYAETFVEMIEEIDKLTSQSTSWSKIDSSLNSGSYVGTIWLAHVNENVTKDFDDNGVSSWVNNFTEGALAYRDFLNTFEYVTNLNSDQNVLFEETKEELNNQLDTLGYSSDEVLDGYLTDLENLYDEFIKVQGKDGITKASVDKVVKGIKDGSYTTHGYAKDNDEGYLTLTKANYKLFEENDAVIELMDQFTAGYDDVEAVKEAVSSRNEYTTAITKDKAYYDGSTKETLEDWINGKKFNDVLKNIDSDAFSLIKDYKENVVDVVLTLDSKLVGSTYVERTEKSAYVTDAQLKNILDNVKASDTAVDLTKKDYGLFSISDKKEGTRYYDELASRMEDVAATLEAVTTDIEALTPANIKATDKAVLEAAEDAVYELSAGKYKNNLTSDQAKEVRKADTKITNLREAFDNLGTTTVAGWYDMGNGNWGYNNEDGTPAAYKWVASGSNWYFVKDGKMVRSSWLATDGGRWYYLDSEGKMVTNQSVDGCWINSYGVYMSPSYNG